MKGAEQRGLETMRRKRKKNAARRRERMGTIVLVCVFIVGLALLLYPTVSNWWNSKVTTRAIAAYDSAIADISEEDYTLYFEAADKYNEELAELGSVTAIAAPDLVDEDYWELLDVSGTGIMGYISIEKINIKLPIYHGTDSGVLQVGAGHLEGTSLPVGGESTHSVISAHRGLPSAKLFTDIDQLEVGDTFTIMVLNRLLTYEVDQITIVEPDELENIYIEDGRDYCTLMTCTPYGINSHRLLVRGVRTENAEDSLIYVNAEAYQIDTIIVASVVAVPLLIGLLVWLLVSTRRKRK
ncbi:MAG: class C sortase [Clostridiales bacterium]|nr:class C sortase [Clostridiales bacterium]